MWHFYDLLCASCCYFMMSIMRFAIKEHTRKCVYNFTISFFRDDNLFHKNINRTVPNRNFVACCLLIISSLSLCLDFLLLFFFLYILAADRFHLTKMGVLITRIALLALHFALPSDILIKFKPSLPVSCFEMTVVY